jgi:predicted lipoprotein with Yx(FWY)xxD motif
VITIGQATVGGSLKAVLKNAKGRTLYYFTPDTSTKVTCTGSCASVWPPLLTASDLPTTLPGLAGKVGVVNGDNGKQVTYNGHPLYTYNKDVNSEDAFGQGIGGKWYVATPDLALAADYRS